MSVGRLATALADRYTIERELGAGGMATVYLAADLRHDRQVAIKVLRPELAAVIGAERFLSEIKTTANLQHPHILPLHDSGEADGFLFYVMPYVQGESLRQRLDREKQLPVDESIRLASEVASALDYAHRHNVIHRDIKPENILLHDGSALVADFGIALAASKAGGTRMTETGMSLGTPHYMSPEQAMGEREITARSDVYALGAVTYEMLTGDPPFTGSTAQAIVARVVTEAPRAMVTQRHTIPPHVEAAVFRALEKLPADRFASASEFATALSNPAFAATGTRTGPSGHRRRLAPVAALGWAAALLAAGLAIWGWLRPAPEVPLRRYAMALPDSQTLGEARGNRIALSPDGSRLIYVGVQLNGPVLWLRPRDQLTASVIPGTDLAVAPFFSPDGDRVGYLYGANQGVRVVSLNGAPPTTVVDSGSGVDGATWSSDGYIYYDGLTAGGTTGIMRVRSTGGRREPVTTVDTAAGQVDHIWPQALPDGRGILFSILGNSRTPTEVAALDSRTGEYHTLVQALTARYVPGGYLIYVTAAGDLLAAPFDLKRLELSGDAFALANGVATRPFGAVDMALSSSGSLMYLAGAHQAASTEVVLVDRAGVATPIDDKLAGEFSSLAISPDGQHLALTRLEGTETQIWTKELPGGPLSKLTFEGTASARPTWSADGRYVGYVTNDQLVWDFHRRRADGTGGSEQVAAAPVAAIAESHWTRDGRWLVASTRTGDILAQQIGVDSTLRPLLTSSSREIMARVSPDGRWISYTSNETGTFELYVRPFPDVESAKWQVSSGGGFDARWSRDGRELLYFDGRSSLMSVEVIPDPARFITGKRAELFDGSAYAGDLDAWDIMPDGKHFLLIRAGGTSASSSNLIVIDNFPAMLRQHTR